MADALLLSTNMDDPYRAPILIEVKKWVPKSSNNLKYEAADPRLSTAFLKLGCVGGGCA